MFHRTIDQMSPWTDRGMFSKVEGFKYRAPGSGTDDVCLLATARALLERRIPDGVVLTGKVVQMSITDETTENPITQMNDLAKYATGDSAHDINEVQNMFIMMYMDTTDETKISEVIDKAKEKVLELDGWSIHDKQHAFLNQFMKMVALRHEAANTVIIVCKKPSIDHWHLMGSMIPAYFNWLFTDKPLDQNEKEMAHSLTMHGSQTWTSKMSLLEDNYDIRAKKIQQLVGGFEKREREAQIHAIEQEINNLKNQMEQNLRNYRDLCARKDDANIRRNGLAYAIEQASDEDELVQFCIRTKSLDIVDVSGTRITAIIRTKWENFGNEGEDVYETSSENEKFWEENQPSGSDNPFRSIEARKKLLDAIILEKKIKVLLCGVYRIDITGYVNTESGYDYPPNCADYMRNYHLDYHHCMGGYEPVIRDYLGRGDTIGALNACVTSVQCINVNETGPTFNPFVKKLFSTSNKVIELPDGTHVSPAKALEWLNKQEGEANE